MTQAITRHGIAVARRKDMRARWKQAVGPVSLLLFAAFSLICAFFVLEEHRAHALGAVPYVLGLAAMMFCIFGHRHAGTRGEHDDHRGAR